MSETPKRPGAKEGGKPAQKPQSDRPQNNRTNGDRGERRPQNDNRTGERRSGGDRPQGGFRSGERSDRPQGGFRSGDRGDRPQGGFRSNDRPQGDFRSNDRNRGMNNNNNRPQQNKPAKPQKPAAAPRQASAINPELDENVNGKMIRHVDMRAANVELDKYNERYENIAPTNLAKRDDGVKKQKIGGRNNKKKNFMSKKDKEMEKLKKLEMERERRQKLHITLPDEITVGDLALKLKIQSAEIVKRLMALGEMKSVSDIIDYDTAALVAMEIGAKVEREVVVTIEDRLFDDSEDKDEEKVKSVRRSLLLWVTLTTARPPSLTPFVMRMSPPPRQAVSPSTSVRTRSTLAASQSPSWIPRDMRRLPLCVRVVRTSPILQCWL